MQISDMLGQYNRNVTNGTEELRSAQGTQKLVSTAGDLSIGSIFEGTVNQVKNGKVLLSLGNGQTISARLDGKVDMKTGSSMFFQVKSNDGQTVSIRPYVGSGNASNPILLDALSAAKIPVTERNLTMVDSMMQEQMAIGKQSILDMVKILNNNPNANVETLVRMVKLGLPVTEEMANQFENYMSDRHMILNEMELVTNELIAAMGDENLTPEEAFALYSKVVDAMLGENAEGSQIFQSGLAGGQGEVPGQMTETAGNLGAGNRLAGEPVQTTETAGNLGLGNELARESGQTIETAGNLGAGNGLAGELGQTIETAGNLGAGNTLTGELGQTTENAGALGQGNALTGELGQTAGSTRVPGASAGMSAQPDMGLQLSELLSEKQLSNLDKLLQNIPTLTGNADLFESTMQEDLFVDTMSGGDVEGQEMNPAVLNKNLTAGEFLKTLQGALAEKSEFGYTGLSRLFSSSEFQKVVRHAIEQQWLIKPENLKEENKISSLYEKMERQISQMENAVKMAVGTESSFFQAAADVRGNIEFMNQMNQIYTYMQMPLKMSGQNANGELYVYTNKKQLRDPEAELTAFLHLDMENLGSTDVSVRLKDKKVKTNFYLPDDKSYYLIEKHLPILEKRLKNKGYYCTITIQNEKKDKDFMETFLQKEQPPAAALHRYSFDVRA